MSEQQQPDHSVEIAQKSTIEINGELYYHEENGVAPEYVAQPKRRYGEKTIKGIVVGRGDTKQVIPLEQVRKLASLNCSYKDMAKFFGVHENTFRDNFRSEVERARETTKHRLMEAMLTNAIDKMNPTVQIWLSKNLCGFSDNPADNGSNVPLPWSADED